MAKNEGSEYGRSGLNSAAGAAASGTANAVKGAKAITKAAAKAASGDFAGAGLEVALNIGSVLKGLAAILVAAAVILLMVFYVVPASIVKTLTGLWNADFTISDIQTEYLNINGEAYDAFSEEIQRASQAAQTAGQRYLDSILSGLHYDQVTVTSFTVGIAEGSPVRSAQDMREALYLLTAIYDEQERNNSDFDFDAYYKSSEAAFEGTEISTEQRYQWCNDAIEEQLKNVSSEGLETFYRNKAGSMLRFFFPTAYQENGFIPTVLNRDRESGPYKDYSLHEYTYEVPVTKQDPNDRTKLIEETELRTGCSVDCEYLWRIEFDGINYLLREYGWATVGENGELVFTEEGRTHYDRAMESAENYKALMETGGLDFIPGASYSSSYSGSYQQLIIGEYDARMASPIPFDEDRIEPLKGTYVVTSDYGIIRNISSVGYYNKTHHGIDMAQGLGSPIYSIADGIVAATGTNDTNGVHVLIYVGTSHNTHFYTLFNHCSDLFVTVGQRVEKGQQVASVGSTGASTGPHLDFGVLVCTGNGTAPYINPRTLVPSIPKAT